MSYPYPRPSKSARTNTRILKEGLASDVIITAGNGVEIPCHKCFLIADSPVLRRMLEGHLKEAKSGRISMTDISEEGVRALLRFIYYGGEIGQGESIEVAYDVLYAAHKYEVSDLEDYMNTYLLDRKDEDFEANVAFKIYCFVRGIDTAKQLKSKMIRIMRMNYAAVKELPEFEEVFMRNPKDAMELCNNLVEVEVRSPSLSFLPMKRKLAVAVEQQQESNSASPTPGSGNTAGQRPGSRWVVLRMGRRQTDDDDEMWVPRAGRGRSLGRGTARCTGRGDGR